MTVLREIWHTYVDGRLAFGSTPADPLSRHELEGYIGGQLGLPGVVGEERAALQLVADYFRTVAAEEAVYAVHGLGMGEGEYE